MSGGSYDYLFIKEADEILRLRYEGSVLSDMSRRLAGLGYADDAARETEELLLIVRQVSIRIEMRQKRLAGVWKAVEWWDSCDSGEEEVRAALTAYREQGAL